MGGLGIEKGHTVVATRSGKLQVLNLDAVARVPVRGRPALSEPNPTPAPAMGPAMVENVPKKVQPFWDEFLASIAYDPPRYYEAFPSTTTTRATAGLLWTNEVTNKPLPTVGSLSVVTDWQGVPLCVIESTHIEVVPFDSVSDHFAPVEGEGDKTLLYWREAHWRFFSRECGRIGRVPDLRMPVVWSIQDGLPAAMIERKEERSETRRAGVARADARSDRRDVRRLLYEGVKKIKATRATWASRCFERSARESRASSRSPTGDLATRYGPMPAWYREAPHLARTPSTFSSFHRGQAFKVLVTSERRRARVSGETKRRVGLISDTHGSASTGSVASCAAATLVHGGESGARTFWASSPRSLRSRPSAAIKHSPWARAVRETRRPVGEVAIYIVHDLGELDLDPRGRVPGRGVRASHRPSVVDAMECSTSPRGARAPAASSSRSPGELLVVEKSVARARVGARPWMKGDTLVRQTLVGGLVVLLLSSVVRHARRLARPGAQPAGRLTAAPVVTWWPTPPIRRADDGRRRSAPARSSESSAASRRVPRRRDRQGLMVRNKVDGLSLLLAKAMLTSSRTSCPISGRRPSRDRREVEDLRKAGLRPLASTAGNGHISTTLELGAVSAATTHAPA